MLELFNGELPALTSRYSYPEFDQVRRTYNLELLNVENYYKSRVYAVKNTHLLVRLLTHINVPMADYNAARYTNVASARTPYVATSFKLTSELNYGELHDGVFYGPGSKEIIISAEEYFNPFEAEKNWRDISAVNVLLHQKSDLGLLLPNGKFTSTGSGLSVFSVNLPLLCLQYRCFCLEQAKLMEEKGSLLGATHFVHMYVLPNMLYSQMDLVIFNRLKNMFYGTQQGERYVKHPFNVIQYPVKVDYTLSHALRTLENRPLPYADVLNNIPAVVESSMVGVLALPELAQTRQVHWALLLSRLDVVNFLIDLGGERGLDRNANYLYKLKIVLKRIQREHLLNSLIPPDMFFKVNDTIEKLLHI